jgi:serine/threonine protein kinase
LFTCHQPGSLPPPTLPPQGLGLIHRLLVQFVRDVSAQLAVLHGQVKAVHLDVKAANVLVSCTLPARLVPERALWDLAQLVEPLVERALRTGLWEVDFVVCDFGVSVPLTRFLHADAGLGGGTEQT